MKRLKRSIKLLLIVLVFSLDAAAQDPQFSQFYAAPLYLNPAFTGTSPSHRLIANYRRQWASMPTKYTTYSASYDYNYKKWNSGFGFLMTADQAGAVRLGSYSGNFLYSYMIRIDRDWILRAGLNFGFTSRSLNYNRLIFGDQLSFGSKDIPPTNDDGVGNELNVNFFDVGSGLFLYSKKYWIGFAVNHINEPNQSITGEKSLLPMKFVIHGGARLPLYKGPIKKAKIAAIAPSFLYKKQGPFDQLDVGINFYYEPMMVGLWYRGLPMIQKQPHNTFNQDAVIVLFGFKYEDFGIGYSYDLTVSKIGPSSGGTHELSIFYELYSNSKSKRKKPRRKDMFMPCPTFMK